MKATAEHSGKPMSLRRQLSSREVSRNKNVVRPPADPADERKTYVLQNMSPLVRVGEYDGDVRNLPYVPAREIEELDLVNPEDQVHNSLPIPHSLAQVGPPSGPMPSLTISFPGLSYYDYCQGG